MLRESLHMSWENIRTSKMRSFLTMLGIMIGVTAIIALITVVQGVTGEVLDQFSELGAGKVTVQAYGTALKQGLNESDLERIEELEYVSGISPTISITGTLATQGQIMEDVSLEGKNELYFENNSDKVIAGRSLAQGDMSGHQFVCLVDENVAADLFFGSSPIGQSLFLNGQTYQVVGIVEKENSLLASTDGKVVIPYKNAMDIAGESNIKSLEIYLHDSDQQDQATLAIESVLDAAFNYKDNSFTIINLDSVLSIMEDMQSMLTTMLTGIASIALLVGGIGIMNMMLVSVTERTKEIGLRKALGAEPGQIQQQFVIEAILVSLFGGICGVGLGIMISYIASVLIGISFSLSLFSVGLGLGFSAVVGVAFGWTPARKASNLKPIDALRS